MDHKTASRSKFSFSLATLLCVITVTALSIAYLVNDQRWQARHDSLTNELRTARDNVRFARDFRTPRHTKITLVATSPNGKATNLSLQSLGGDQTLSLSSRMLESDHFGSVLCRYLGTIGERDIYEVLVGCEIASLTWEEFGSTEGVELKTISYIGNHVVAFEKNGFRVELVPSTDEP